MRFATLSTVRAAALAALCTAPTWACSAGGPLGIDHRLNYDDSGIWSRHNQLTLQTVVVVSTLGGALWEGRDSRLGSTLWKSVDAMAIGAVAAEGGKLIFSRSRPVQTDDPNQWFKGHGHKSFPSGEVLTITSAVTPILLEYADEHPAVWSLALLPLYDAAARVKVQAHWQSDVLASLLIGAAVGTLTHSRHESIFVGILPQGVTVGWKKSF